MAKIMKGVAIIAGVVATVASFVPGGQLVAAIASGVSTVAGTLAQLTAKPPRAVGQASDITIGANQPIPYLMGYAYSGGALIHDTAWGGEVSGVDNPYAALTIVYSGAGPIKGLVKTQAEFTDLMVLGTAVTGYYNGFLWRDFLPGVGPAPGALVAQWPGEPNWGAAYKLSGFAAIKWSMKFDKKGKIWASGVPQLGGIFEGVYAYDPRQDSTVPGGSGPCRIGQEGTYVYSRNAAVHACTYAYGRYQNGKKIFGVDLGDGAIDLANIIAWANICDANGWTVNGTIYEPGDKWDNIKLIAKAGGGQPIPPAGGLLRFDYDAPVVSVDTIRPDDLISGEIALPSTQGWAQGRLNGVTAKYTSPDHKWEAQSTDPATDAAFLAFDGEPKEREIDLGLVTNKTQAAQLAAYHMRNSREMGPIVIACRPRLGKYPIGTALTIGFAPLVGQIVKIKARSVDPITGGVTLTLMGETPGKHALALGQSTTAPPPTPIIPPQLLDTAAIGGQSLPTQQYPDPLPEIMIEGGLYIDQSKAQHRFVGSGVISDADDSQVFSGADDAPAESSGFVNVQDSAIDAAALTSTWSGTKDDNGLKPQDNADVTSAVLPVIESPASRTFTANAGGGLDAGQLPATFVFRRFRGAEDVTATSVSSVISQSGITGGTVTISDGVATIPAGCQIATNSKIVVQISRDGLDLVGTVAISRSDAGAANTGGGGTTVSDTTLNPVSGTSFIDISDEMTVRTGANGTISFSGMLNINAAAEPPAGFFGARMRWWLKPVGGSFAAVGPGAISESEKTWIAEIEGLPDQYTILTQGTINVALAISGYAANTDYIVVLRGARDAATEIKQIGFGGIIYAQGG